MIREKQPKPEIVIDLTGPQGNVFFLLGAADRLGKQIGYTLEEREILNHEMKSGDYENLINVFESHFGHFVILER